MQTRVPEEQKPNWLLSFDKRVVDVQEELGILNNMTNYTFLTDTEGRIRWSASGKIHEHEGEGELLTNLTNSLIAESKGESFIPESVASKKAKAEAGMKQRRDAKHKRKQQGRKA